MKKKVLALIICLVLVFTVFFPITTLAFQNGYVVRNLNVTVFGYSYTNIGPYDVPDYVDSIAIMLNKQIDPSYLSATTLTPLGIHPLELEFSFEEISGSSYLYWFDLSENRGSVEFVIANGTNTPIGYRVNIVY